MTLINTLLAREESQLRKRIIKLGDETVQALNRVLQSYPQLDTQLCRIVIEHDQYINALQLEIREECIITIARQQPVAKDLRELIADIEVASELERIADHAASMANIVQQMAAAGLNEDKQAPLETLIADLSAMTEKCISMLKLVIKAYADKHVIAASEVAKIDIALDLTEKHLIHKVFNLLHTDPTNAPAYTYILWISHNLERSGDLMTNIAERIIYIATGEIVDLN